MVHNNHPVSAGNIKFCPERRRLSEQEKTDAHIMMMDGQGKPMAIRDYLNTKTGKAILSKDLQNMRYVFSFLPKSVSD